jgi:hypothetical protein
MADTILIKRSLTPGAIPTSSSLQEGELALNIADKKIYTISGSTIVQLNDIESVRSGSYNVDALYIQTPTEAITITGSSVTSVFNETAIVEPYISATAFSGAEIIYNAQRTGASRFGTLMTSWSGSQVVYTDNSTNDVGETWDLSFQIIKVNDEVRLRAYSLGSGSGEWNISFKMTLFPNLL